MSCLEISGSKAFDLLDMNKVRLQLRIFQFYQNLSRKNSAMKNLTVTIFAFMYDENVLLINVLNVKTSTLIL